MCWISLGRVLGINMLRVWGVWDDTFAPPPRMERTRSIASFPERTRSIASSPRLERTRFSIKVTLGQLVRSVATATKLLLVWGAVVSNSRTGCCGATANRLLRWACTIMQCTFTIHIVSSRTRILHRIFTTPCIPRVRSVFRSFDWRSPSVCRA